MGGRGDDRMTKRGEGTGLYGQLGGDILKVGVTSVVNQKLHKEGERGRLLMSAN